MFAFLPDLIGRNLGPYRILEPVGRGGMASVFKAYEASLDRYVAVKVLPQYDLKDETFLLRFEREARAIARLNHPNILPVYSFGHDTGLAYIAMQYVETGTLKDLLGRPLSLDLTGHLFGQIGRALHYAHQHNIIHRDIKPSNVLIGEDNWVLLADFGLAKMMESLTSLTQTGVGMGTPAYMAPEQGMGSKVDERSDIYSLGVVLYEMVTGRVPFDAETPMAIVLKHISAPLPLPATLNPNLPEAVQKVILKSLAKEPDDRYRTAAEMASALEAAVAGSAALVVTPPPVMPAQERPSGTLFEPVVEQAPAEPEEQSPPGGIAEPVSPAAAPAAGPEAEPPQELVAPAAVHEVEPPQELVAPAAVHEVEPPQELVAPAGPAAPFEPVMEKQTATDMEPGALEVEPELAPEPVQEAEPAAPRRIPVTETIETGPRPVRSRRTVWIAGLVVLFLVISGGAVLLITRGPGRPVGLISPATQIGGEKVVPTATQPAQPLKPSLPPPVPPTATTRPVVFEVELISSSDWVSVTLNMAYTGSFQSETIDKQGKITESQSSGRMLWVNQTVERAMAGHQVSIRERVTIGGLPGDKTLRFHIEAGCIGAAVFNIYNTRSGKPILVGSFSVKDCKPAVYDIGAGALLEDHPGPVPAVEPPPHMPPQAEQAGSKIVSICEGKAAQQLCIRNITTGEVAALTNDLNFKGIFSPSWSPGGEKILFSAITEQSQGKIYLLNADGSGLTPLAIPGGGDLSNPAWSPDGSRIAYVRDALSLETIQPDGAARKVVYRSPGPMVMASITWSPDGKQIAFLDLFDWDNRPTELWLVNAGGSDAHKVFSFPYKYTMTLAWPPGANAVVAWDMNWNGGRWVALDGSRENHAVIWDPPTWWLPSFWPYFGGKE